MTITIPWALLAHDNHRLLPVVVKGKVRQITAPDYRAAKTACATLFNLKWRGAPLEGPVEVVGVAYFPDRRKRDAGNYRKLLTDALTGIAYEDDAQVHRETWERGPVDRTNPRIELTVTPLVVPPRPHSADALTCHQE